MTTVFRREFPVFPAASLWLLSMSALQRAEGERGRKNSADDQIKIPDVQSKT